MEKVQEVIRKYEDIISAALQLVICIAAVVIALNKDKSVGRKEKEKLAKTEAKLRQKAMKTEAKIKQKARKLSAKNDLKLQKEKFRRQMQKNKHNKTI